MYPCRWYGSRYGLVLVVLVPAWFLLRAKVGVEGSVTYPSPPDEGLPIP
jgi:hypothetical protein